MHLSDSKVLPLPRTCPKTQTHVSSVSRSHRSFQGLFPFLCNSAREKDEEALSCGSFCPFASFLWQLRESDREMCSHLAVSPPQTFFCTAAPLRLSLGAELKRNTCFPCFLPWHPLLEAGRTEILNKRLK